MRLKADLREQRRRLKRLRNNSLSKKEMEALMADLSNAGTRLHPKETRDCSYSLSPLPPPSVLFFFQAFFMMHTVITYTKQSALPPPEETPSSSSSFSFKHPAHFNHPTQHCSSRSFYCAIIKYCRCIHGLAQPPDRSLGPSRELAALPTRPDRPCIRCRAFHLPHLPTCYRRCVQPSRFSFGQTE